MKEEMKQTDAAIAAKWAHLERVAAGVKKHLPALRELKELGYDGYRRRYGDRRAGLLLTIATVYTVEAIELQDHEATLAELMALAGVDPDED